MQQQYIKTFLDSFNIILSPYQRMSMITLGEQGWALESFFGQDYVTTVRLTSSKKEGGSDAQSPAPSLHVNHIPDICHFFTLAKFLENKIYTEKRQFFALNL